MNSKGKISKKISKKVLILLTILMSTISAAINLEAINIEVFDDVNNNVKYRIAIDFLGEKGILTSYSDGSFKPEKSIERSEFLSFVMEAAKEYALQSNPEKYKDCFSNLNRPLGKYICLARENEIITRYLNKNFKPEGEVTLIEALEIILEVFAYQYKESSWLECTKSQTELQYKNVIDKASNERFIPFEMTSLKQNLNRGQAAEIITRILKKNEGKLDRYLQNTEGCEVDFASLRQNKNMEEECLVGLEVGWINNYFLHRVLKNHRPSKDVFYANKNIKSLSLNYRHILSIKGLEKLKNLQELELKGNNIKDLSFLKGLKNLKKLNLQKNDFYNSELEALKELTQLEELNLSRNSISDISALKNLKKLKTLLLYNCRVTDIKKIQIIRNLKNLKKVDISWNGYNSTGRKRERISIPTDDLRKFKSSLPQIEFIEQATEDPMTSLEVEDNMIFAAFSPEIDIKTQEGIDKAKDFIERISGEIMKEIEVNTMISKEEIVKPDLTLVGIIIDDPAKIAEFAKKEINEDEDVIGYFRSETARKNALLIHWDEGLDCNYVAKKIEGIGKEEGIILASGCGKTGTNNKGGVPAHTLYFSLFETEKSNLIREENSAMSRKAVRDFIRKISREVYTKLLSENRIIESNAFRNSDSFLLGSGSLIAEVLVRMREVSDIVREIRKYPEVEFANKPDNSWTIF